MYKACVCVVHVYEIEFVWNTGLEHGVLKKIICVWTLCSILMWLHIIKHQTFQEERFFCCFCFTADKIKYFQNKIFYYGFSSGATTKPSSLTAPEFLSGGGQKVEDSQVVISIASSIVL